MKGYIRKRTLADGKTARYDSIAELPRGADGKRRRIVETFHRRKDAERRLARVIRDIDAGEWQEPTRMTFGEYVAEKWLPAHKAQVRESTWVSYRRTLQHVLDELDTVPLRAITPDDLTALYGRLAVSGGRYGTGLAPRTIRYVHTLVRKVLADAVNSNLIPRNPAERAKGIPKQTRPHVDFWTRDELRTFLDATADSRLGGLWRFIAMTGLRRGEAIGMRWEDVDLEGGRVFVRQSLTEVGYRPRFERPKTGAGRQVSLDPGTVETVRRRKRRQIEERLAAGEVWEDSGLVWTDEIGRALHPQSVSTAFDRAVKRAGVKRIRLHDLRHTHATLLLAAGQHPKVVSERLGHSKIAVTLDTYSHVIPTMDAEAANVAATLVDGPASHEVR